MTIRLIDARRGLNRKCKELFGDEKIAEQIYRYLCDGIEECEDAERTGQWIPHDCSGQPSIDRDTCSVCGQRFYQIAETGCEWNYCPDCGARMESDK